MKSDIPLVDLTPAIGPGAHSEDETLSYLPMPKEMYTFEPPSLPEPEVLENAPNVTVLLERLQAALDGYRPGMPVRRVDLETLSDGEIRVLHQILGEGEVAVQLRGNIQLRGQETILAGVWWLQQTDASGAVQHHWLEVADAPELLRTHAFTGAGIPDVDENDLPGDILNAGPVLVELLDIAREHQQEPREMPHVINLSLLPFSPEDHAYLARRLGEGHALILSRGYGNCRITATAVPGIWRVQYFNSTDQLILDTLEVVELPQVACAATEDLEDSAERLREIREVLL